MKSPLHTTSSLGFKVLGVWVVAMGLVPLLSLQSATVSGAMALLAVVAGVLVFLGK